MQKRLECHTFVCIRSQHLSSFVSDSSQFDEDTLPPKSYMSSGMSNETKVEKKEAIFFIDSSEIPPNQVQHMWDLWDTTAKGLGTGHIQGGVAVVKQPSMPEIKEEQENNE